jgi:hypothetical protein
VADSVASACCISDFILANRISFAPPPVATRAGGGPMTALRFCLEVFWRPPTLFRFVPLTSDPVVFPDEAVSTSSCITDSAGDIQSSYGAASASALF